MYQEHLNLINFSKAKSLLKEGDVLLFKGRGLSSFFIKRAGEGKYSHAAIASAVRSNGDKIWECIEFRERKGGRSINLEQYCKQDGVSIDVFRPVSSKKIITFLKDDGSINEGKISFNGKKVTNTMRKMTGLPYGWKRIAWIALHKFPFLRLLYNINSVIDDKQDLIYPVCSTAVAYSFSNAGYDLIHNRADNATEPNDIARSPLLFYLFTISP